MTSILSSNPHPIANSPAINLFEMSPSFGIEEEMFVVVFWGRLFLRRKMVRMIPPRIPTDTGRITVWTSSNKINDVWT